jgi:hypothetical protein
MQKQNEKPNNGKPPAPPASGQRLPGYFFEIAGANLPACQQYKNKSVPLPPEFSVTSP